MVRRDELQAYMNTSSASTAAYNLIGEGFTDLSESKNPKEYSRHYVHERTDRTDVVGFAPSISYSCDVYSEDPVCQKIVEITDGEKVGEDAHVDIVVVHLWEAGSTSGTYVAYKRTYACIPDSKGSGTDALIYSGNFKAVGEIVKGTFATETKTFTPDA